jgi:hypothetical protein
MMGDPILSGAAVGIFTTLLFIHSALIRIAKSLETAVEEKSAVTAGKQAEGA